MRSSAALIGWGFVTFFVIVIIYSELLQHEGQGLESASWSAPFLLAIAIPVWAAITWFANRRARRRSEHRAVPLLTRLHQVD